MEANPGTFERERFAGFRSAGVNRLSLGVQSFDDARLAAIGRVHDAGQARQAAAAARGDLPDLQSRPDVRAAGADAGPAGRATSRRRSPSSRRTSRSTTSPSSRTRCSPAFRRRCRTKTRRQRCRTRSRRSLAQPASIVTRSPLTRAPAIAPRHNLNYWTFGDYLGIGAGAHGKLSFHDRIMRQARFRHPRRYVEAALAGQALEMEPRTVAAGPAVRVHAERSATGRGRTGVAVRGTDRPVARRDRARPRQGGTRKGLLLADPARLAPTPLGSALPERSPGDVPAGKGQALRTRQMPIAALRDDGARSMVRCTVADRIGLGCTETVHLNLASGRRDQSDGRCESAANRTEPGLLPLRWVAKAAG